MLVFFGPPRLLIQSGTLSLSGQVKVSDFVSLTSLFSNAVTNSLIDTCSTAECVEMTPLLCYTVCETAWRVLWPDPAADLISHLRLQEPKALHSAPSGKVVCTLSSNLDCVHSIENFRLIDA